MSRTFFLGGVALMLGGPFFSGDAILTPAGAFAPSAAAQPSQPIYLQYDGYVKNTDGTYTLSFGYFNQNQVAVSIQPGEDNTFTPGPADRNQPILFEKGRRRFACSMVVSSDFDGALQWTVRIAGKTSTTTSKMLDPLYELELNSAKRVTSGLDLATAPRGVCVNRAPSAQVINPLADINAGADTLSATSFATRPDQELSLGGSVEDDGLPRGGKLTVSWKKISGPGEVAFSDTSQPVTRARFTAMGVYELELSATDTERASSVKIKVTVN
jgi:hypothetical protein